MMIGTDGTGLAIDGPMASGVPHPRGYGTFPRVLGRFVRDLGILEIEEALHKMTGLPARKLHRNDRGLIKPGLTADLVVFDPNTVADVATYDQPHRYASGIHHVLVNGRFVIRDGAHTGKRPGKILRLK
jgi:N-acyl-D-amino-acid deacylase